MADNYDALFQENMGALKQILQQQQQIADTSKPTGIFANVDPVMLGLAQGFLSPTKTGGFGESIGAGLAGAQAPLEAMRKRQMDAQEKILQTRLAAAKLAMEAPYYARRGLGAGVPSERSDLLAARDYDQAAAAAEAQGDDATAASYRATARALRDRHAVKPTGATEPSAAAEAPPAEEKGFFSKLLDAVSPSVVTSSEPSVTGALVGEKPSKAKSINEALAEGAKGKAQAEAAPEAPAEAAPETQFYTGDTAPKQFPQARKAPDGKWYVVQDGKYRPVLK